MRIIFLLLSSFLFTSCFDIVEEISLKNNGSGKIKATVNLSKAKTKVASLLLLDSVNGMKIPKEVTIKKELNTVVGLLKKTAGVTNVKSSLDFTNYIASIECDFANLKALNSFTQTISNHFKIKISGYTSYTYDDTKRIFTRGYSHSRDLLTQWNKLDKDSKKSMESSTYTGIYRFESAIKSQQNSQAIISPNKKAVMLKTSIPSLAQGNINLSNKIFLEN